MTAEIHQLDLRPLEIPVELQVLLLKARIFKRQIKYYQAWSSVELLAERKRELDYILLEINEYIKKEL